MRKKGEDEVPLAFLPMSEKRPGPFMAMAAAAATAAGGRGRGVEGEAAADRSRGERRGQTVRRRRHEVLCGARQMNDRRAGLVRVSSSWSLHCTFSAPAFPRFHRTKDLFFFLLFKEKENSAISDNSNLQLERPNYTSNFPNAGFCFSEHLRRGKGNQISPAYTANLDQISGLRSVNSSRHLPGSVSSVPGLHKTTAQLICFT